MGNYDDDDDDDDELERLRVKSAPHIKENRVTHRAGVSVT